MLDFADDWIDQNAGHAFMRSLAAKDPDLRRWAMASPRRALAPDFSRLAVARSTDLRWNHAPRKGERYRDRLELVEPEGSGAIPFPEGVRITRVTLVDDAAELELDLDPAIATALGLPRQTMLSYIRERVRRPPAGIEGETQEAHVARLADWFERSGVSTPELRGLLESARAAHAARTARHDADRRAQTEAVRAMIVGSSRLGHLGTLAAILDDAIHGAELDAHADEIRSIALPCLALAPRAGGGNAAIGTSRVGGLPDLLSVASWPRVDGAYLSFLAQIDLGSLPPLPHSPLPPRGLLSLFLGENESTVGVEHRVLLTDEGVLERVSLPANAEVRDEYSAELDPVLLSVAPTVSLPGYQHQLRSQLTFTDNNETMARYDRLVGSLCPCPRGSAGALLGHGDGDELDHAIDGYAASKGRASPNGLRRSPLEDELVEAGLVEDPVRLARGQEALREYQWWISNATEVARESHGWRLLMRLESLSEAAMNFWDAGTLNVYIHEDDLRARRFDRTRAAIETS